MRRALVACAAATALLLSACGGSSGGSGRNIGRTVQRELRAALARSNEASGGRRTKLTLGRCLAQPGGGALPQTTTGDVLALHQDNEMLQFDCTVTQSVASDQPARWIYDLQVRATGQWQLSLQAAAPGGTNAASCDGGICTGPSGVAPPLALSGGQSVPVHATRPAGPAPKWGKGLEAMSDSAGAKALAQAQVTDLQGCLALATADGYPSYAIARRRPAGACTDLPRGAAREYFLERHDGVWEMLWEGNSGCPPALPAAVIRAMFHLPVSSCEDS